MYQYFFTKIIIKNVMCHVADFVKQKKVIFREILWLLLKQLHCKTDEAHVPHNFKSMESGSMTNLLQTSKS